MAHATTYVSEKHDSGLLERFGAWISHKAQVYADRHPRMIEVRRLQAMTDTELAARGLTRDGIARHVFRDVY